MLLPKHICFRVSKQPVIVTNDHAFCLGVNELTGMVFAQPISGKAWSQLEPVLVKFLQTQPYTRTVVLDGEAALSVKNIKATDIKKTLFKIDSSS